MILFAVTLPSVLFAGLSARGDTWTDHLVVYAVIAFYFFRIPALYIVAISVIVGIKTLLWKSLWKVSPQAARKPAIVASFLSIVGSWGIVRIIIGALNPGIAAQFPDFLFAFLLSIIIEFWFISRAVKKLGVRLTAISVVTANIASFFFLACWNNLVINHLWN